MTLQSMTGFVRVEGRNDNLAWTWEARSVNGKGLDVRCRLPQGLDELEVTARDRAGRIMARGNVTLTLNVGQADGVHGSMVDRETLDRALALVREFGDLEGVQPPRLDGLLRLPGVLDSPGQSLRDLDDSDRADISTSLDSVLADLADQRAREGGRLQEIVEGLLDEIEQHVEAALRSAGAQPEQIRQRLQAQIEELVQDRHRVGDERLAQEVALLATRADVREEIDRLKTHVAAMRDLLAEGGPAGRRLGFLCQELLREANTLCSKSADTALTAAGLDLKVAVDRLREQVQNLE